MRNNTQKLRRAVFFMAIAFCLAAWAILFCLVLEANADTTRRDVYRQYPVIELCSTNPQPYMLRATQERYGLTIKRSGRCFRRYQIQHIDMPERHTLNNFRYLQYDSSSWWFENESQAGYSNVVIQGPGFDFLAFVDWAFMEIPITSDEEVREEVQKTIMELKRYRRRVSRYCSRQRKPLACLKQWANASKRYRGPLYLINGR